MQRSGRPVRVGEFRGKPVKAPQGGGFGRRGERGARSFGGGFRPQQNDRFGGRGNGGRGGFGKRRGGGENIHFSRFINKADPAVVEEVRVSSFRFTDLPLDRELQDAIAKKHYDIPSPIQEATIPHVLRGKDVVGIANTGTGKTAAFLIPLIQKVRTQKREQVIIITPTRELAIQIEDELRSLTRGMRIYSVVCVGGVGIHPQLRALRYRNEFVIGTPGRLKDLMERGVLNLATFNTIVLDEADRMLDMGFVDDMRFVMKQMPKERQTLFFSATLSPEIKKIVGDFLHEPEYVSVKTRDTSKNVDQDVVHIAPHEHKVDVLHKLLSTEAFDKVIVFGRTKHGVERLATTLHKRGIRADSIHGDKDHKRRVRALTAFKNNDVRVLVATDVAARGLDIPNVSHVINYDVPNSYDDYVHRIGRTGRADKKGIALTFIGEGAREKREDER